jgi:hypothetical protein
MFIYKRSTIVPQKEHSRLSATIASFWGNKNFKAPNIPTESFIKGIMFHDRGFGVYDTDNLMKLSKAARDRTLSEGIRKTTDDPAADIITLRHICCILKMYSKNETGKLLAICEKAISLKMKKVKIQEKEFDFAEDITNFVDDISFDFSQGKSSSWSAMIKANSNSKNKTKFTCTIKGDKIRIRPWPLSIDHYTGSIVGYSKKGYPKKLNPKIIQFTLTK